MQAQSSRPEDRVREGSATAPPPVLPATATMSTTTARTKRSASMALPGASAGAGKGRDPSPAPAPGGRARLRDEQLRQLRELFLRFDLDSDGSVTKLELAAPLVKLDENVATLAHHGCLLYIAKHRYMAPGLRRGLPCVLRS